MRELDDFIDSLTQAKTWISPSSLGEKHAFRRLCESSDSLVRALLKSDRGPGVVTRFINIAGESGFELRCALNWPDTGDNLPGKTGQIYFILDE